MDVFWGCLGVAAIILALGAVRSIPELLAMLERVSLHDPREHRRAPSSENPPTAPWGRRP